MPFIEPVPIEHAEGETKAYYEQARENFGYIPNFVGAFSLRPGVMKGWNGLLESIKGNMDERRYELVTMAAAKELKSSYCMLAHGSVLLDGHLDEEQLKSVLDEPENSQLNEVERAIMDFATKVVSNAASIESTDVEILRGLGLTDAEIFDVVAAASARCFFSKTLDALGVRADANFKDLDDELKNTLVVGRKIEGE